MKKGYFLSLEVLIATLIILSPILYNSFNSMNLEPHTNKEKRIYEALNLLEKENKIVSPNLEKNLEEILGFNVTINKNCTSLRYFVVEGVTNFKIIDICY